VILSIFLFALYSLYFIVYSEYDMIKRLLDWLIILLPFALPLYVVRFSVGPLPTTVLEVYLLVLMVTWLISIVKRRTSNVERGWIVGVRSSLFEVRNSIGIWFWPLIVWLAVTLVAVFVAQDSLAAFGHWRAFMLEPVLVFFVLLNPPQSPFIKGDAKQQPILDKGGVWGGLFLSIAILTIILGVYAIFQYVTGWGIPSPWDVAEARRATGIFGYPNGLSLFIVPFGIVSFIKLMDVTNYESARITNGIIKFQSTVFLIATVSAGIATTLAKSMGGILAFGVGVVLTLIVYKKTRLIGIVLTVLGVLGAGLVAWNIYGTELHPQTIEDSLASSKKWSSSVRVIIWKESFEIIKDNPIFGTGLRSFKTAILPYHEATWMETFPHPHNILLMLWIETGLAGLLAFLWLIGTWVRVVHRTSYIVQKNGNETKELDEVRSTKYENLVWIVPLVVILVHGMVDMPYFKNDLAIQFFLLAALATTIKRNPELVSGTNK
jgi:O-antigen ligase